MSTEGQRDAAQVLEVGVSGGAGAVKVTVTEQVLAKGVTRTASGCSDQQPDKGVTEGVGGVEQVDAMLMLRARPVAAVTNRGGG